MNTRQACVSSAQRRATCSRRDAYFHNIHLFTFCRTDGRRSVNVPLFRYVQMFGSGHVRSFHVSVSEVIYSLHNIHIIHN